MVIYCNECGSKAVIEKTDRVLENFSKLYCACKNKECNHRFVMNLEFSHSTRQSDFNQGANIKKAIEKLSDEDKQELIAYLLNAKP